MLEFRCKFLDLTEEWGLACRTANLTCGTYVEVEGANDTTGVLMGPFRGP